MAAALVVGCAVLRCGAPGHPCLPACPGSAVQPNVAWRPVRGDATPALESLASLREPLACSWAAPLRCRYLCCAMLQGGDTEATRFVKWRG